MVYAKATAGGRTIAESPDCIVVENNYYFPPASVDQSLLRKTQTSTHCPWKGDASYYTINIEMSDPAYLPYRAKIINMSPETELKDAAWYYPKPFEKAENIKDYVAFYKTMVQVTDKKE